MAPFATAGYDAACVPDVEVLEQKPRDIGHLLGVAKELDMAFD